MCKKFDYANAFDACVTADSKLCSKEWNVGNLKSFLKHQGISNRVIEKITFHISTSSKQRFEDILPTLWNPRFNYGIDNQIPAIMHLLFLGITQTTGFVIRETLINHGKYMKFCERSQLEHLRHQSIDWCRVWIYGSNKTPFGPWTSENYLAYACIFKLVYSCVPEIMTDKIRWNLLAHGCFNPKISFSSCCNDIKDNAMGYYFGINLGCWQTY